MAGAKQNEANSPAQLAERLTQALLQERIVPRFVDSYVVEHSRHALQVHAVLYRDLLARLQREALLAACVRALEVALAELEPRGKPKSKPMLRKDASTFRRKFLTALANQQKWNAGDALDFQTDLRMYEELIARNASSRRARKPFEAANHPFVDRCAFMLDSSFMADARLAASHALTGIEELAAAVAEQVRGGRVP